MLQLINPDFRHEFLDQFVGRSIDSFVNSNNRGKRSHALKGAYPSGKFIPIDITVEDDNVIVCAELPGVDSDTIKLEVEENVLRVEAFVNVLNEDERSTKYILKERQFGSMSRMIQLPHNIDVGASSSSFCNGILEITLPKIIESKARRIPIN